MPRRWDHHGWKSSWTAAPATPTRWTSRRSPTTDPRSSRRLGGAARGSGAWMILRSARAFEPRHRDALVHGVLDAADGLDEARRRDLIRCGLDSAQASVRRTALDRLCELDDPEAKSRRARADTNAAVRKWRPRHEDRATLSLLAS